ncbi:OmpA family protein [Hymenobacter lutimineralis]|uniref:OmpA family protein n=1 Tax=Hymenobacter lutimineralis TaxID=2606448 RepID=A0A5D6VG77_9BACT|nr:MULTISPECIES: PA14 domain-containing protein [Hymenobacter]QIX61319.1 OmpA family protein [Hymenobacter sp. BT18]TYZ13534.1 OmpA family protein [Hymenobacter lutimineralis]
MKYTFTWLIVLLSAVHTLAQTSALPVGDGLKGAYYNGMNFEELVFTRIDKRIDFSWEKRPPGPDMPSDEFSVRWTGWLLVPETAEYEFSTVMDDGFRFWLGGKRLVNAWRDQDHLTRTVRIKLKAGQYYPIRIEYFQNHLDTRALLDWRRVDSPDGFEPVSSEVLFTSLPRTARPIPVAKPKPAPPAVAAPTPKPTLKPVVTAAPVPKAQTAVRVERRPRPTAPAQATATIAVPARPASVATPPAATPDSLPNLANLVKGEVVELKNLYFEQGKARLLPTSQPELNRLVRVLRAEAAARFEIAGHTDNVGDARLNQQLSEQRAQVVRRYLVQHGVDSLRLTAVGYGGAKPVADNRDPRLRPRNRRVELIAR